METKQDWQRIHNEYYAKGPTTEERVGIVLLFAVPVVWLFFVGLELWRYHNGL